MARQRVSGAYAMRLDSWNRPSWVGVNRGATRSGTGSCLPSMGKVEGAWMGCCCCTGVLWGRGKVGRAKDVTRWCGPGRRYVGRKSVTNKAEALTSCCVQAQGLLSANLCVGLCLSGVHSVAVPSLRAAAQRPRVELRGVTRLWHTNPHSGISSWWLRTGLCGLQVLYGSLGRRPALPWTPASRVGRRPRPCLRSPNPTHLTTAGALALLDDAFTTRGEASAWGILVWSCGTSGETPTDARSAPSIELLERR